ncbi:MAG: HNH endonuclease signature motif containing protein, partial [Ilumatobacteraceae bacterium]
QVDPVAVVLASFVGRVRRLVMDRAGVVIELGRRQRLFTGSSREAALLQGSRCCWPGCGRPRTQIDHTLEWSQDGLTDPVNAGPMCGRHNLIKQQLGYTVWRDEHGRWHTYRPDGTEIVAA